MNAADPDQPVPEPVTPADAGTEATPEAKPKRKRAPRKTAAVDEAAAGGEPAAPALEVAPEPAPAPVPIEVPVAEAPTVDVTAMSTAPQAEASPAGDDSTPAPAGDDGPRKRNRNRRRGRKGDRAPGDDSAAPLAADDTGDGAEGDGDGNEPGAAFAAPRREPAPAVPPPDAGERFAEVLSGAYDAEPVVEEVAAEDPGKRVLAPEPDAPKLHKVLAQAGIGSRRDMEELIDEGRVSVNGEVAHTGQRISWGDQIRIDDKPVKVRIAPPPARVIAYHKPVGEVVTHDDPQNRPTVFRRLPRLPQGKWQSVGRLDINTEGLLLFTNSGELANQLMHPRFGVEREYAVRVLGTLEASQRERLLEGVEIDGQRAGFRSIDDGGGEGVNHWYRVVITEGRNREVRKLFDAVGLGVSRLIRIRYGCVVLPRGLKRGVWVDLNEYEVKALRRLAGGKEPGTPGGAPVMADRDRERDRDGKGPRNNRRGKRGRGPVNGPPDVRDNREPRPPREVREPREPREPGEGGPIPNPLQQTYDRRAIREARAPKREIAEDGPIPNPLEQTYDKRFVQKPRGPGGGGRKGGGGGGERQPDPMQTSVGYIGADAFHRKMHGGGGGGGGGGNRNRGRKR